MLVVVAERRQQMAHRDFGWDVPAHKEGCTLDGWKGRMRYHRKLRFRLRESRQIDYCTRVVTMQFWMMWFWQHGETEVTENYEYNQEKWKPHMNNYFHLIWMGLFAVYPHYLTDSLKIRKEIPPITFGKGPVNCNKVVYSTTNTLQSCRQIKYIVSLCLNNEACSKVP